MALGRNKTFPIYNADGTPFHGIVLHKATYDSTVMSLGDKITGDAYYNGTLAVTMQEYIEWQFADTDDIVRFVLVNPPTVVREGLVKDNSEAKGMTKYSFEFYHPMYMLASIPFNDVATTADEQKYLSESRTFAWIGKLEDFVVKIDKNLQGTIWEAVFDEESLSEAALQKAEELSDVLSFTDNNISDALKKAYEVWTIPFTITQVASTDASYALGKRFRITFGMPSQEILGNDNEPYIFRFGQGVGLKNNSRTPRNNKIVTRIAGYGAETNIPWGYPQIVWTGNQSWEYTINNDSTDPHSYPIYDGVVGGQKVRLIKHPFTRTHLMPSVYVDAVNKKVNPRATGYDPTTTLVDYYDATAAEEYPNPIVPNAPSSQTHAFDDIYPRLADTSLSGVAPYDNREYVSLAYFTIVINASIALSKNEKEKDALTSLLDFVTFGAATTFAESSNGGSYTYSFVCKGHTYSLGYWYDVKYTSGDVNFQYYVYDGTTSPADVVVWDDSIDDDGNYVQSYFELTLPQLAFDLYACAIPNQEMSVNMRSGDCLGCTFPIEVDWEDYRKNFYLADGTFDPTPHTQEGDGHVRDITKYPDSSQGSISIIVQKDTNTFGILKPNVYQQPHSGDMFVFLGISLAFSYITAAQERLDSAMKEYMLENNVYYFDYPLKFDEFFLAQNTNILAQIRNNSIVHFMYNGDNTALFIKQISIKYGEAPLPQYTITLTDDIDIVLNQIGQVTDEVSRLRVQMSDLQRIYGENVAEGINEIVQKLLDEKLSKVIDDVCQGRITFQRGLDAIGNVIFSDELRSDNFNTGLYTGKGWRVDQLGNAEFESIRARSYLEVVELLINRLQAQEGDTMFTDNDQIDKVEKVTSGGVTTYILSLKQKYDGYVTAQMYGNVLRGIINTLAAKQAGVSDVEDTPSTEHDGENSYYTSWMRVIDTHNTDNTLGVNQIRVVLYGDNDVPSGKNFEPCELMNIARWGCVDYADPSDPDYEEVKESIRKRQNVFYISTSEGRIVKLTGVDAPILHNWNYGTTLGELPDFVRNNPFVAQRIIEGMDYLYAQGVVVESFIQIDREGRPIVEYVDCGEWVDGSQVQEPTAGNGIYLVDEYNQLTGRYETHDVWHEGVKWRCLQHQPVRSGGVDTYYEPKWNSPYWMMIEGNSNLSLEFSSSRGFSFRRGAVDTVITPSLWYGNIEITDDVPAANWHWTRHEEVNEDAQGHITYTEQDLTWNAQHIGSKTLHLTNADMPAAWSSANKAIFTCYVLVNDGQSEQQIQNQIIS